MKVTKSFLLIFLLLIISGCSLNANHTQKPSVTTPPELSGKTDEAITPSNPSLANTTPTANPAAPSALTELPSLSPSEEASASPTIALTTTLTPTTLSSSTSSPEKIVLDIIAHMSLEEKVGQMFFVRCNQSTATVDIKKYHLGGYILFSDNFKGKTKKEVRTLLASYQKLSKIPLLIGVDEEGGTVNRISKYTAFRATAFRSPQKLYQKGGYPLITADTVEKAQFLKNLGINVNLAPVCDVSTNPSDFIYLRSFGKNAKDTSVYVKTVVTAMKSAGIGSTLKHFPGYGNNKDTHTGSAIDTRGMSIFEKNDFLPFQAGITAGADSILVSHNIVTCMDKKRPASLSVPVHALLRKKLGFNGVIMTDDLSMDAITQYTGKEEAAVLAITAGNDLLISSSYNVQLPAVLAAVRDNKITQAQINSSVKRILLWKLGLGLIKE